MRHSDRGQIDPFIVMDVMEQAARAEAAGRDIIHMEVGQPATGAPATARAALQSALDAPLGYTLALGLPALREGIAALYRDWYGLDIDPSRVIVTPGSSGAFLLTFSALFDAGARLGMGEPGYPSYRQIARALSIEPVGIPTLPEHRYQPRPEDLPEGLDGLMLASPGNPSGTMLGTEDYRALLDHASARNIAVISDEIYHGLSYGAPCVSALNVSDDVVVINSFSKYFGMTGWRIGWMVVPPDLVRIVERLAQNMFICAPHASQVAALGALQGRAECEANLGRYAENRALMLRELPKMGFDRIAPPDGAFYIYADVSALTSDSRALAAEILDGTGVALTPGVDFDPKRGHQTLRFSYAGAPERIAEGLARLAEYMARRGV